jgi:hypothetical protein
MQDIHGLFIWVMEVVKWARDILSLRKSERCGLHETYKVRTESHERQFFVKLHSLLLTNQIHHLNLHTLLYFST